MATTHRAGDDSTQPVGKIGLRIMHRSSALAPRAAAAARGYIKRKDRIIQYLERKKELEILNKSDIIDTETWCPQSDEELCSVNGALVRLNSSTGSQYAETEAVEGKISYLEDETSTEKDEL